MACAENKLLRGTLRLQQNKSAAGLHLFNEAHAHQMFVFGAFWQPDSQQPAIAVTIGKIAQAHAASKQWAEAVTHHRQAKTMLKKCQRHFQMECGVLLEAATNDLQFAERQQKHEGLPTDAPSTVSLNLFVVALTVIVGLIIACIYLYCQK